MDADLECTFRLQSSRAGPRIRLKWRCGILYQRVWIARGVRARGRGFAPERAAAALAQVSLISNATAEREFAHFDLDGDIEVNITTDSITVDSTSESASAARPLSEVIHKLIDSYPTADVTSLDRRCSLVALNNSSEDRISAVIQHFFSSQAMSDAFPTRTIHGNAVGFHEKIGDHERFYDLSVVGLRPVEVEEPGNERVGLAVAIFEPFSVRTMRDRKRIVGQRAFAAFQRDVEAFMDEVEKWLKDRT